MFRTAARIRGAALQSGQNAGMLNPFAASRLRPALLAAAIFIVICTLTRIALALRPEAIALGAGDLASSFAIGFAFDLVTAIYVVTPLLLWLALAPDRLARAWLYRAMTIGWFSIACFAFLFTAVAEWLFWEEFSARFNFIAVDYLLYTHEVIGNIWESYPTGKLLAALALAAAAITAICARRIWRWTAAPSGWRAGLGIAVAQAALVAVLALSVTSGLKNRTAPDAANELAGNGIFEFFTALRSNELSYERYYATLPIAEALATVRGGLAGADWINPDSGGVERLQAGTVPERKLNVVLVSVESLGAEFLGAYGDRRGLTPNLDRLAKESLWFSRVYATGNRTVRGLEALALSLPPTPGQSIVRRPGNDRLFSLGGVFEDKGYAAIFAYGGYGYFDNMNAFFEANDYRAVDRRDIPKERIQFENIWGVADEHLYDQALEEIDREKAAHGGRPVFVHVMTTSNHRPYTYPAGRIDIPSGTGREGAVKYTDYAIGYLFAQARKRPWFKDTVFVVTADHGASARGTARIPVEKYLIPLFVYAPAYIAPRRIDRLMSQIDIPPTLLGLLDFRYYTKFLGRDVLRSAPETDRAFVGNYQTLAYLKDDRIVVLQPKRKVDLYRLDHGSSYVPLPADAAITREAIAYYQVASYLFRNGLYLDEEQTPPKNRIAAAPRNLPANPLR
jgi:phosphoglycerol transferase MdoB-like AlkP superfamily enzyme